MSVKLALLKSGETIISDIKELVAENSDSDEELQNKEVYAYIFSNPRKVFLNTPVLIPQEENSDESSVKVSLSPWIILTEEENIPVPTNWVVTFVEPIQSLKVMYENQVNGKAN